MEKGIPGEIFKVTYRSQNLITFAPVLWYTYLGSMLLSFYSSQHEFLRVALTPTPQSLVKTSIYPEKREEDKKNQPPLIQQRLCISLCLLLTWGREVSLFFYFLFFLAKDLLGRSCRQGKRDRKHNLRPESTSVFPGKRKRKRKRKIRESRRDRRRSKTLPHADIFSVAKSKLFRDFGFVLLKKIGRYQCNIYFGGRRFRLNWIYLTQKRREQKKEGQEAVQ